jgi:hypothetical protein
MKSFTRMCVLLGVVALAFLISPDAARAQNSRNCAWPIEMSPEGATNVQFPDGAARYWVMPFDTTQYETMTINGTYPNARYFSFAAYETIADGFNLAGHLYDAQIVADPGTVNSFVQSSDRRAVSNSASGTYTIVISRTGPGSANKIVVSEDIVVWVLLRMYVADADPSLGGQSLMGGVPLPTITLTDSNGASRQLDGCSTVNKWLDASAFDQILFPPAKDVNLDEGTPSSDRLWFAPPLNPPSILWPNPDNKYMMMLPGNKYQSGRIMVIHGKAPGFPNTFDGSPIWVPSRGFGAVDMRYWALCNADFASPFPVIACATDLTTRLSGRYYTIVISDDLVRPKWLRALPNINWLPYGDEQYPKVVAFRNMLPEGNFPYAVQNAWAHGCTFNLTFPDVPDRKVVDDQGPCAQGVMGDYYPAAVWCDKATFIHGRWNACLKGER